MRRPIAYYIKIALLSICVTMALCMDYQHVPSEGDYTNVVGEILLNLYESMSYKIVLESILAALMAYLLIKMDSLHINGPLIVRIFSCTLAMCWVLHLSYTLCNSISLLYCTAGQIIKTVILLVGFTTVIDRFSCLFNKLCSNKTEKDGEINFFKEHCYFKIVLILFVVWLPHVVLSYPGNMLGDTWNQITMACEYNGIQRTTAHPAVMTMLLYGFVLFGRDVLNNANIGLFLYEILQVLGAILGFSYMIKVMIKEFHAPRWLTVSTFVLLTFSPYFCNGVTIILKDIPYSVSYMVLATELALFLDKPEQLKEKKHVLITALSICFVYFFRTNGVLALILIIVCFGIVLIRKHMFKYIAVFIAPMLLSTLVVLATVQLGGFSSGSKIEALCLPMQQVGRIVKFFPEDVSDEQREILENVCDYDRMATAYNALIADPVKESFYKWENTDAYMDFLKVWLQLAVKHPMTAISATLAQNLPLISPSIENEGIYTGVTTFANKGEEFYGLVAEAMGIQECSVLTIQRDNLTEWYQLMSRMPVIGLFSQQAIYVILLLGMACYAIHEKNKKFLAATIPAFIGMMIILGPCIQFSPRYTYPIVYQIPMLVAFFIYSKRRLE